MFNDNVQHQQFSKRQKFSLKHYVDVRERSWLELIKRRKAESALLHKTLSSLCIGTAQWHDISTLDVNLM